MGAISQTQMINLLEDGQINVGGAPMSFAQALQNPTIKGNKALYETAKAAFKDAKAQLKKGDNDQAMEVLVRAYTILTSKKLDAGPAKAKGFWQNILGTSELKEHAKMVKESKELFASHFDSYLRATHQRVEDKKVVKQGHGAIAEAYDDTHTKLSMLQDLAGNTARIDTYIKEFNPEAQKLWQELKQQLAEKKLSSKPGQHAGTKTSNALDTWNKLRPKLALPKGRDDNIATTFKDDDHYGGLTVDQKISGFLNGNINVRALLGKADNPTIAKTLAQMDNLKEACKTKPALKDAIVKLEVALLRQNVASIETLVKKISKESNHPELANFILGDVNAQGLKAFSDKLGSMRPNARAYERSREFLAEKKDVRADKTHSQELFEAGAKAHIKTPSALGIDAHTVTIGNNNNVVSSAPKNADQVKAYFTNLENNNTQVIVTLHEDYEKGMGNFHLIPENVGDKIKHGNVEITLIGKGTVPIENTLHGTHTLTTSTIEVKKDGVTRQYDIVKIDHWDKENTALDLVALRKLSDTVQDLNQNGRLAVTSNEGTGRAATFLLYHELAHGDSNLSPTEAFLQFSRVRPATSEKQFATVVGALHEERLERFQGAGNTLPAEGLERVKTEKHPEKKIAEKLINSPEGKFLQFYLKNDKVLAEDMMDNKVKNPAADQALSYHFEQQINDRLFDGLSPAEKQILKKKISHLGPKELDRLVIILNAGDNVIKHYRKNIDLLKDDEFFNAKYISHKDFPLNKLVETQIRATRKDSKQPNPPLDFESLIRLKSVMHSPTSDFGVNFNRNINKMEDHFKNLRTYLINKQKDTINDNPALLMILPKQTREMLGVELINKLTPNAMAQLDPLFFQELTEEQRLAISPEQANVLTLSQWTQFLNTEPKIINKIHIDTFTLMPRELFASKNVLNEISPRKMLALIKEANTRGDMLSDYTVDEDTLREKKSEVRRFMQHINPAGNKYNEKDWDLVRQELSKNTLEVAEFQHYYDANIALLSTKRSKDNSIRNEGFPILVDVLKRYTHAVDKIVQKTDRSGKNGHAVFTTGSTFASEEGENGHIAMIKKHIATIDPKSVPADRETLRALDNVEKDLNEIAKQYGRLPDIREGYEILDNLRSKIRNKPSTR
ncbi:MAG: protein-tyrosine phosphatase family protein [Parachlamydiales bacterium]|jgi:hypothetical protein